MSQPGAAPVLPNERIELLDIIRGFALFGVLLVNMALFKSLVMISPKSPMEYASMLDGLTAWIILVLAEGKFYVIFSFLFGLGFYIFMERAEMKGLNVAQLYRRRLFGLLIIGIIHMVIIWSGDILLSYSVAGFFLLLFRKRKSSALRKWIVALLIVAAIPLFAVYSLEFFAVDIVGEDVMLTMQNEMTRTLQSGTYTEILIHRFYNEVLGIVFMVTPLSVAVVLPLFLLGFYAGKKQIFRRTGELISSFRKVQTVSFLAGLLMSIIFIMIEIANYKTYSWSLTVANGIIQYFTGILLGTFYVTSIVVFCRKGSFKKFIQPLGHVGRMALTNYLMQSIICVLIFYGYGLGMFGQLSFFKGLLLATAIFATQIVLSGLWLKYYAFGPFEWLWRMFTYKKTISIKQRI